MLSATGPSGLATLCATNWATHAMLLSSGTASCWIRPFQTLLWSHQNHIRNTPTGIWPSGGADYGGLSSRCRALSSLVFGVISGADATFELLRNEDVA